MNIGAQLAMNALVSAAVYTMVGISFAIPFRVTKFFNLGHGAILTLTAYFTLIFKGWLGFPLILSIFFAIVLGAALGGILDLIIFRPFRHRNASALMLLLVSLGIYIIIQNALSLFFGDAAISIRNGVVRQGISVLGARITPVQMLIIFTCVIIVIAVWLLLKYVKFGHALRGVADDPELAALSGIESDRVIFWSFAIGSALAGLAGVLLALDIDMTPRMGMHALLMGIIALIIGGSRSIGGVVLGSLLLGFAMHFGVWKISSQWQDAIAFIILIGFLLFRPQGFFGKKTKTETV